MPAIIRQVGGSVVSASWVMNGYNLVLTVLFLPMGRLADRYGHKLVFTLGLALFTAASLPCALAGSIPELVAWRWCRRSAPRPSYPRRSLCSCGRSPSGAKASPPGCSAPSARSPWRPGRSSAACSSGTGAGRRSSGSTSPSGCSASSSSSRSPGPAHAAHPRAPRLARRRARQCGALLRHAGIIQGNDWGWTSGAVIGLFAGGGDLLLVWVWWELRTPSPLFDLRLFRDRTFAASATAIMTVDTAMMGTTFMSVIFMVAIMDYSELKAGLAIAVLPVAVLILASRRLARGPNRATLAGGDRGPGDRRRARRPRAPRTHRAGGRRGLASGSSAPASGSPCRRCSPPA